MGLDKGDNINDLLLVANNSTAENIKKMTTYNKRDVLSFSFSFMFMICFFLWIIAFLLFHFLAGSHYHLYICKLVFENFISALSCFG